MGQGKGGDVSRALALAPSQLRRDRPPPALARARTWCHHMAGRYRASPARTVTRMGGGSCGSLKRSRPGAQSGLAGAAASPRAAAAAASGPGGSELHSTRSPLGSSAGRSGTAPPVTAAVTASASAASAAPAAVPAGRYVALGYWRRAMRNTSAGGSSVKVLDPATTA